jgi:transcriptional regulator with XRE-family HTH domain
MPRRSATTRQAPGTERLGSVLRKLRTERAIPHKKLVEETGLSRSYLSYLESGRFTEIGLEKFARLIRAMDLSADDVLQQAGYLPPKPHDELPAPQDYLRDKYQLPQARVQLATEFLEFLARGRRPRPKARTGKRK